MSEVKFRPYPLSEYPSLDEKATTIYADPCWKYSTPGWGSNPENKDCYHYPTMSVGDIAAIPVDTWVKDNAHCYLWVPNGRLADGLQVMKSWGFRYVSKIDWIKLNKDGSQFKGGLGNYFRTCSETLLFGVRGKLRTLDPARAMINLVYAKRKRHSVKPEEFYSFIEAASPGPYLELFARNGRKNWRSMGNESPDIQCSFPTSETFKAA
jgi:N6-adenosine-specific RNA methylase IME4